MIKSNKIAQFELLRIISSFFVVLIHVTSIGMRESDISIFLPNACFNALSRWSVPVFFMVSGALLLDPAKDSPPQKIIRYISRAALCILVWGTFYSFLTQAIYAQITWKSIPLTLYNLITGNAGYHLWFLYTLAMLYIALPVFRVFTKNASQKQIAYALLVWAVLSVLTGQINVVAELRGLGESVLPYTAFIFSGYSGYFLLGHYLREYPLAGRTKKILNAAAMLSIIMIICGKLVLNHRGVRESILEMELGVPILFISAAFFNSVQRLRLSTRAEQIILSISRYTFGVYLLHPMFIFIVYQILQVNANYFGVIPSLLFSTMGIWFVSFVSAYLMSLSSLFKRIL